MKFIHYSTPPRKIIRLLIASNIILFLLAFILILNKFGIISKKTISSFSDYSYLDNAEYEANLSMLNLSNSQCDIAFIGDSLTARCHFDELLETDKSLLNRGIGSDITEGLYNRIDEVLCHSPTPIFVMVGINDIGHDVPTDNIIKYYRLLIEKILSSNPDTNIYLQSILPVCLNEEKFLNRIPELNQSIQALAAEYKIMYVDLYSLFLDNGSPNTSCYATDGVHLNGNGYKIWMDFIQPLL